MSATKKSNKADDLFVTVTNRIIAEIEAGASEWRMPWKSLAHRGTPVNVEGRPYRGFNALWLAILADDHNYESGIWGTYKAWQSKGAQVCKGQKGTQVVLWKPYDKKENDGTESKALFATTFTVFAAEQVDGSEATIAKHGRGTQDERPQVERLAEADAWFAATGAVIRHSESAGAYYASVQDYISVPHIEQFKDVEHYYTTLAHEATHWTGHKDRLGRDLANRFGDEKYAAEELVAELGAAFFAAQFGLDQATRQDHAAYLNHWLGILRSDPKALVTVMSKAQAAIDHLNAFSAVEVAQAA